MHIPTLNAGRNSVKIESVTQRPVHSLHDAAVTLIDGAIDTLKSATDDEAVHAARKACKGTRAALRLLRESLGSDAYRRQNERVRDAAKPLTAVRDAFVLRMTLGTMVSRSAALKRRLDSEYRQQRQGLERQGARRVLQQLRRTREALVDLPPLESEGASAIAGLRRIYKMGRKACRKARRRNDEALHECRKQSKYLLNQLELLKAVFNIQFKKIRRHADRLAEDLGKDHDLAVLKAKLRVARLPSQALKREIMKRRSKLQTRALLCGKRLYVRSAKHIEAALAARLVQLDSRSD
jgi:CHAD domain-containing protein